MSDTSINVIAIELIAQDMRAKGESFAAAQLEMAARTILRAEEERDKALNDIASQRGRARQFAKLSQDANARATLADFKLATAIDALQRADKVVADDAASAAITFALLDIEGDSMSTAERQARATTVRKIVAFIRNRADTMTASQLADEIEAKFYRQRAGV